MHENYIAPDKPVIEWTEKELNDHAESIAGKRTEDLNDLDLEVISRLGEISAQCRTSKEVAGMDATIEVVRRKVQHQVNRIGMARYLKALHADSANQLIRKNDPEVVVITMNFGIRTVSLDLREVSEATNGVQGQPGSKFTQIVADISSLIELCANNRRTRIEKSDGKNYSGFTTDIKFGDVVTQMAHEDNPE